MPSPDELQLESTFVRQRGDGDVPLLLLNGLGAHHGMLSPFVDDLTRPTVVFDWPGMGRSPALVRPRSVGEFVDLAVALARRLGHDRIDVLGYSFGGAVALHLAAAHPNLVRRLVLVAAPPGWGAVLGSPAALMSVTSPLRYYSRLYLAMTSPFTTGGARERDPEFLVRSAEVRHRHRPDVCAYYGQVQALMSASVGHLLGRVGQPALLVYGEADPVVPPANGRILADRLPDARLRVVEEAGHLLLQCQIPGLAASVSEFLELDDHMTSAAWRGVGPSALLRSGRESS